MMTGTDKVWSLHPKLEADCHRLLSDELCEVLLHRNASLHWILLVPRTTQVDLLDLPPDDLSKMMRRAGVVSQWLKTHHGYPRVNVGALGLLVPQLHLHVIGRSPEDPCWPNPVWGQLPDGPLYIDSEVSEIRLQLTTSFNDSTVS